MRVLLDTNVLAVGAAEHHWGQDRPCARIWQFWQAKKFELLVSEHILNELKQALRTPWFRERLTQELISSLPDEVFRQATVVEMNQDMPRVTSHWQDDLVLSAAISGNADYLVTRDAAFRRVGEYQGVKIRTPDEFLQEFDARTA
ncbi:MAG: putative toxin-antitoxin system toxin component, PIN family [Thermomicrobiales bacterium]